jgi:hypothetical protein
MQGAMLDPSFERQIEALRTGLSQFGASTQRRTLRQATSKGLRVLQKSVKAEIPSEWKQVKPLIGVRMLKAVAGQDPAGKVGAGVGKQTKARKARAADRAAQGRSGAKKGVGISASNVHWPILGTGQRQTKSGKSTGRMPPQIPDIVKNGVRAGYPQAVTVMIGAVQEGIDKEASKLRASVRQAGGK